MSSMQYIRIVFHCHLYIYMFILEMAFMTASTQGEAQNTHRNVLLLV